jgi:hypothetical protein
VTAETALVRFVCAMASANLVLLTEVLAVFIARHL